MFSNGMLADKDKFIENYFKKTYLKNALLSYIIYPFEGEIQNNHSNHWECFTIAQILDELGYKVDVINWNNDTFIPAKKYDLVIDNHNNLARLHDHFAESTVKVFHATNAFWQYQNHIEYKAALDYRNRTGIPVPPNRTITEGNSAAYADFISMFGNEFTKCSFGTMTKNVYHVPMSVTAAVISDVNKDFSTAKYNFIWLNSHGALLKGLDIVVGAFSELPECNLYVFGNTDRDQPFWDSIQLSEHENKNIHLMGWTDINSDKFMEVANRSAWVISASRSEGGGGSVLNCMAKGLIPVISKSTSITLPGNSGYYIEPNEPQSLMQLIKNIIALSDAELEYLAVNASSFVRDHHTLTHFKKSYRQFLEDVINVKLKEATT